MADLITRANLQTFMGLPIGADAQLDMIITGCSARIEEFCGRTFLQANYTEYLCGNGTREICLRNRPVITTNLAVRQSDIGYWGQADDAFPTDTLLDLGGDYALKVDTPDGSSRSGILYRITGVWPRWPEYAAGRISPALGPGVGNIKVAYTGGYATVPADVQQACALLCASVRRRARLGEAPQAESRETYSYNLYPLVQSAFGGMPPDSLAVLARYRNLAFG